MREDYIPWTDWEDADGRVVDSDWEWLQHDDFYEGRSTFEITLGGTPYKVQMVWEFYPDQVEMNHYTGTLQSLGDSVKFTSLEVEDGDVPIYDETDGETMPLKKAFLELLDEAWLFDFADELFPIPYPQEPDVPSSGGDYGDFQERRLHPHTPWNYSGASARKQAQGQFTHEELLGADWEVVDCDYREEGHESWSKYGPDLHITHYSGQAKVQTKVRGQTISFIVTWFSEGTSDEMRQQYKKKNPRRPRRPTRWEEDHDEMYSHYPDEYYEKLSFEVDGISQIEAPNVGTVEAPNAVYDSVHEWVDDYSHDILFERLPVSEVLCGLK